MKPIKEKLADLHSQREHWEKRFNQFFPKSDDLVTVVLHGHLLVEEILEELIRNYSFRKEAVAKAKLTFFNKTMLAKAFVLDPLPDEVWDSILALNALRNAFAHSVEPSKIEEKIRPFTEYRLKYTSETLKPGDLPVEQVRSSIAYLLGQLSILDFVTKYMESCKKYG